MLLSRFDGGSAFLYRARLSPEGTLTGNWWSGSWSVEDWTATRDENATLGANAPASKLKNPDAPFTFSFPDLDGKPVSLDDARFRGKVVIVSIGGSWCPNCHDEAKFLQPYYEDLHARVPAAGQWGSVADTAHFVLDRWSTAERPKAEREAAKKLLAVLKGYACQTA